MANGGRKSLPRRILEAADAFASSFSDAELKLFGAFGVLLGCEALKRGRYRALTRRRIQRELARVMDNICAALAEEAAQTARQALLTAYAATAETIADEIEAFAAQTEAESEQAQREMIKIVDELTRLVNESAQIELKHMRRDADDIYRQIVEKVREAWLEPGNASKLNAEVQEALNEFAASGVTGFTDKAGRKWGLYEYANMAMRTAIHRAGLQATIDTMRAKGQDLAYITRHPGACPLCARWYGVILSLSGADPTHPSLQGAMDQGLFHPNCADVLQPYIPGVSDLTAGMGEYTPEESAARYTASQHQRALEREIRKWKRMQAASTTPENERMCKAHVDKLQRQLRTLTGETKLPRRYDREGGRVLLSADAKKLKPFTVGEDGRIIKTEDTAYTELENATQDGVLVVTETRKNHGKAESKEKPNAVIDVVGKKGGVSRYIYDASGNAIYRVDNHDHGYPQRHPFKNGEHYHVAKWDGDKWNGYSDANEIPQQLRKLCADILKEGDDHV